jgi:hypothetical protein
VALSQRPVEACEACTDEEIGARLRALLLTVLNLIALSLALIVSSPARQSSLTSGVLQASPTASLEARVSAYWERRRLKDLSGMYEFYSSDYRSRVSREEFMKNTRLVRFDLTDIVVAHTELSGDRARVTLAYRMQVPTLGTDAVKSGTDETWVRESDGVWRKLDEPLVMPFSTPTTVGSARG